MTHLRTHLLAATILVINAMACEESAVDDRTAADAVGYTVLDGTTADGHAMPVHVWYPGTATDDAAEAVYVEGVIPGVSLDGDALVDLRAGDGSYPVLLYSHGLNGYGDTNPRLVEPLAAAGWVVVAPDHIGSLYEDESNTAEQVINSLRRPDDLGRSLALVAEAGADDSSPLALAVDAARAFMLGHSMGAATALHVAGWSVDASLYAYTCENTPGFSDMEYCQAMADAGSGLLTMRPEALPIAGAVAMAPGAVLFLDDGATTVDVPLMNVGGSLDTVCPMTPIEEMTELAPGPKAMASLDGSNHYSFAGFCDAGYQEVSETAAVECAFPDRLEDQVVLDRMLELVEEWAAWHLDGDGGAQGRLETLAADHPELSLVVTP
jgi:predicted dienelactone hydrolase